MYFRFYFIFYVKIASPLKKLRSSSPSPCQADPPPPPPPNLNSTSDSRIFHVYGLKGIALESRWGYQKTAKIDLNKFKLHIVTLKCFCHFFSFCVYGMLIYNAAKVSRCNLSFSLKILHFCSFFPFIET